MSRSHLATRRADLAAVILTAWTAVASADETKLPAVGVAVPDGAQEALAPLADALEQAITASGLAATPVATGSEGAVAGGSSDVLQLRIVGPENVNTIAAESVALARLTDEHHVVVVPMESTVRSLADLMDIARVAPDSLAWAASGSDLDREALEAVAMAAGVDPGTLNVVPLGTSSQREAIVAGKVPVAFGPQSEFLGAFRDRSLRALAISAPSRIVGVDIPTFREQGFDVVTQTWRGVAVEGESALADAPAFRVVIGRVVKSPEWQELVEHNGWTSSYRPTDNFGDMTAGEP